MVMQLTLEVQSPNELQLILQYIRLLPTVKVLSEPKKQAQIAENNPDEKPKKDFMQYYGTLNTGLTLDEIDEKINQMRSEWDRDFS